MDFTIDPKLRDLIPPLTGDERAKLAESIRAEGVRHPLTVWEEEGVLVDGHHRHEIACKLDISYETEERSFASREQAETWMIENQLARRNLTPDQYKWLKGLRYNRTKKAPNDGGKGTPKGTGAQNAHRLAESEHPATVRRWASDVQSIEDAAAEPDATDDIKALPQDVVSGKKTLRQAKEQAGLIPKRISDPAAVARRRGRPGIVTVELSKTPEGVMQFVRKHLTRQDAEVLAERLEQYLEAS